MIRVLTLKKNGIKGVLKSTGKTSNGSSFRSSLWGVFYGLTQFIEKKTTADAPEHGMLDTGIGR